MTRSSVPGGTGSRRRAWCRRRAFSTRCTAALAAFLNRCGALFTVLPPWAWKKGKWVPGTLEGIGIIEIAGIGPAPFAGMMLADHGATVIRVEREDRAPVR